MMLRTYLIPRLVWWFYKALYSTWTIKIVEHPDTTHALKEGNPLVLAHWHGDELALLHIVKKYHLATMTSTSKDGELIDFVIKKLDGATSRGSSTRGGVQALKGLIRLISKEGHTGSVAVDGPKGPIYVVKHGVLELSRLSGARIVTLAASASRYYCAHRSWNKAILPKPFATVIVCLSAPMPLIPKRPKPDLNQLALEVAEAINETKQQAEKIVAGLKH